MAQQPNNVPSVDPANDGDLPGMLRAVFGKLLQGIDGMLPARVVAFNDDRNSPRVTVQPLVALITTGGQQVSRAQIASLPVFQFGAGGFLLSFPIQPGDLGWIMANDRDISLFLQSYAESRPHTFRKTNFADALFIPDIMRGYSVAEEDEGNAVLQNADGSVRVALWPDKLKLTAPRIELDTPITHLSGDLEVDGTIEAVGEITSGDINVTTHRHVGVQPGGGTSGTPTP
jgi:hypothetical protein